MRKFLILIKVVIFISLIQFFSCNPDEPTPDSGDIRDKLVSDWKCQENSATYGAQNYYVDITKDTIPGKIVIDNFFNLGFGKSISASVNGQIITINNQVLEGNIFNGSGTISSNYKNINWSYTFDEGNGPEEVTAVYTKM